MSTEIYVTFDQLEKVLNSIAIGIIIAFLAAVATSIAIYVWLERRKRRADEAERNKIREIMTRASNEYRRESNQS